MNPSVEITVRLFQEADSCTTGDQELVIKTDDAGGGSFVVLSSKRWAMDGDGYVGELCKSLQKFQKEVEKIVKD